VFSCIPGIVLCPASMQTILEFRMPERVKVMFVALQSLWTSPGHVAHQILFASFDISRLFGCFTDEADLLGYEPMSERVDVEIELEHYAQLVPVFFETVVIVGIPSARQKERISIDEVAMSHEPA
jgi:hypothetical protein